VSLLRNAAFNVAGALLPALALFITIPLIVQRLGAEAYGALALVTSIVGYFGIIDVNATAGTVKYVAEHDARRDDDRVSQVVAVGAAVHLLLGLLGAAALFLGAHGLVHDVFRVDPHWRAEAELTLRWSALGFFVAQMLAWLKSLPQALQRYDIVGRLDALFGSLVPVTTLAVVAAGGALVEIVVGRLLLSLLHLLLLQRAVRTLLPRLRLQRPGADVLRALASFSAFSWMQRLAALTTQNADKLLIGAQHSMATLAAYVIPLTLVGRVFGLLFASLQAVFPLASALQAVGDTARLRHVSLHLQRYTLFLNVCACLLCAGFAKEWLHYWLQGRLPQASALVLVAVAYTLLADSTTNVPSLVNDGLGRPHLSAGAVLVRAVLGVSAAVWVLARYDIVALAASQLLVTVLVSTAFIGVVHRHSLPWRLVDVARPVYALNALVLGVGTVVLAWRWPQPVLDPAPFAAAVVSTTLLLGAIGWMLVLRPAHRQRLLDIGRRRVWLA
jgi:O-antigen/teichoic acid export membrane protein